MPRTPPTLRRLKRLFATELRYGRILWLEFRWSLLFTATVWGLSTVILHEWYVVPPGEEAMTWARAAYYVLMMTAFEAALEFHNGAAWAVKAVYFALPLLGLFVIIDSIVRFMGLAFRQRVNNKEWQELLATTFTHHVIVCGLGHVGYRTVQQLVRSGTDCVVIEVQENSFVPEIQALGVPVIIGDARRSEALTRASVTDAVAVIAATDNDLTNLEIGLTARELKPGIRIVARLFDQALAKKVERSFDFDACFSAAALAAPVFAAAAIVPNVIHSVVVEGQVLNTVELVVREGSALVGRTVGSLRDELEVTFLMYQDGTDLDWNPEPNRVLRAGVKVLVVTTLDVLRELELRNRDAQEQSVSA